MRHETKDGVLILYMEGNLLGAQANQAVMSLVMQNIEAGHKKAIFNLQSVNYVDSAGLGMLLSATSKIKNAGGKLALCNLPEQVKKLLKTTKVESVFTILTDEPGAVAALNG